MKNKKKLTRRKASKIGMFDPYTFTWAPSPSHQPSPKTQEPIPKREGKPIVAIIGKPNVGKSSIFNRLVGQSKSLVSPIAGTTRDRVYGICEWDGWEFVLVDTGGMLGDTDEWSSDIHDQAIVAIEEADIILVVCSIHEDITAKDKTLARLVRNSKKPSLLICNKADNTTIIEEKNFDPWKRLGLGDPLPSSAIHAIGEVDIIEAVSQKAAEYGFSKPEEDAQPSKTIKIAIVGKPNVGKSSFLNRIVGAQRSVTSPISGTTTDPVDENLLWIHKGKQHNVTLIESSSLFNISNSEDTAGLKRKKYQEKDSLEHLSALWALKVISRADISILLVDSKEGVTSQDAKIASFVAENFKSCLIVWNKWDVVQNIAHKETTQEAYVEATRHHIPELNYCPVLFCSATTGYQVADVMNQAIWIANNRRAKIRTTALMRCIATSTLMKLPPKKRGRRMKIKFASQADTGCPTITLFVNDPSLQDDQYTRFLTGRFREEFPTLEGSPVVLVYRKNSTRKKAMLPKRPIKGKRLRKSKR